jgi:hypothetical protein
MKTQKSVLYTIYLSATILIIAVALYFYGNFRKIDKTANNYQLTGNIAVDGQNLVQQYCTNCHKLVPVDALTRDVWIYHILPSMSEKLGVSDYGGTQYYMKDSTAKISLTEWSKIVAYYDKMAPDTLVRVKPTDSLHKDWAGFKLSKPAEDKSTSFTTMAISNPYSHTIYTSDLQTRKLMEWNDDLKPTLIDTLQTTAVSADFIKDNKGALSGVFSSVGTLQDIDFYLGKITKLDLTNNKVNNASIIASGLPRPMNVAHADFNKDGLMDYVVSCVGHSKGGLYLLTQTKNNKYNQTVVRALPGAIQAITGDFNHDGWPDIMALFGTGDEGIWMFLNDHKGGFIEKNILRFPPVYGSSSFQLVDFNKDGAVDILYTCGNNFANSRILKPYHGVYIFLNTGNFNYKQRYFYPINGCTKAIAADFKNRGKLDIATSAFFADLKNNPEEGFIYFEQDSLLTFKPHALPISKYGRWFTMDIQKQGDKTEIVLGNYSVGFKIQDIPTFWNTHLPFVILKNLP